MNAGRVNRIALGGWAVTLLLAALGPIVRRYSGVPGSGSWLVYTIVAVMGAAFLLIRRDHRALFLALLMSASGVTLGGSIGFLVVALSGRPLALWLALKWAFATVPTTWLFVKQLHQATSPLPDAKAVPRRAEDVSKVFGQRELNRPDLAALKSMSEEERKIAITKMFEESDRAVRESRELIRRSMFQTIAAIVLIAVGFLMLVIRPR